MSERTSARGGAHLATLWNCDRGISLPQTVQAGAGLRAYSSKYGPGKSRSMRRRTSSGFSLCSPIGDVLVEPQQRALGRDEANLSVAARVIAVATVQPLAARFFLTQTKATVEGLKSHARMTSTCVPIVMCGHVHHSNSAQSSAANDATGSRRISSIGQVS